MSNTTIAALIDGAIALAIIAATTVTLCLHDIDATTALALYGAALALVGGSAKAAIALRVPAPTQTVTPPAPQQTTTTAAP